MSIITLKGTPPGNITPRMSLLNLKKLLLRIHPPSLILLRHRSAEIPYPEGFALFSEGRFGDLYPPGGRWEALPGAARLADQESEKPRLENRLPCLANLKPTENKRAASSLKPLFLIKDLQVFSVFLEN
jgi:hypothetical protein